MNFKIVEQEARNFEELYNLFKEDYINPHIKVTEIKEKYNLSNSEYKHLRQQLKQETGIETKPNVYRKTGFRENPDQYIHRQHNGYIIKKNRIYYGRFKNLDDARKRRDELKKNGWKKEL